MAIEKRVDLAVVKYGSSCLKSKPSQSRQDRINDYVDNLVVAGRRNRLAIVTSGAVALGKENYEDLFGTRDYAEDFDWLASKQVFASLGSAAVTEMWRLAFKRHGYLSGQVLVTHSELKTKEAEKLRRTYEVMSKIMTPVINQNDALVIPGEKGNELDKIATGSDNDWLAADVAQCLGARALIFCTGDVDGMEIEGEVEPEIRSNEVSELLSYCQGTSEEGSGGMESKLLAAAWWAEQSEQNVAYICNSQADLANMLDGANIGTRVVQ